MKFIHFARCLFKEIEEVAACSIVAEFYRRSNRRRAEEESCSTTAGMEPDGVGSCVCRSELVSAHDVVLSVDGRM